MRRTIAGLVVAATLAAAPCRAQSEGPGWDVAFASLAAASNLFYTPAKVVVAVLGGLAGAVAGTLNGGDQRAAYAFWVPTMGGTYFITADMMDGGTPIQFFGDDYADRPSSYGRSMHGTSAYDARYEQYR